MTSHRLIERRRRLTLAAVLALLLALLAAPAAEAQVSGFGKRIAKRAQERAKARADSAAARADSAAMAAEEKAMQSTDRALDAADTVAAKTTSVADNVVDRALSATEHVVRCALGDVPCIRRAKAGGASVVVTDTAGVPVSSTDSAQAMADAGGGAERLLFFEDYASAVAGAFPATLRRVSGAGGVLEANGERRLRATSRLVVAIPLPETLPARFSVEFDVAHTARGTARPDVLVHFDAPRDPATPHVVAGTGNAGVAGAAPLIELTERGTASDAPTTVRILVAGDTVAVEIDGVRAGEWSARGLPRGRTISLALPGSAASPMSLGAIRVAEITP